MTRERDLDAAISLVQAHLTDQRPMTLDSLAEMQHFLANIAAAGETTLVGCHSCGRGVRPRDAVLGRCAACAAACLTGQIDDALRLAQEFLAGYFAIIPFEDLGDAQGMGLDHLRTTLRTTRRLIREEYPSAPAPSLESSP